MTDEPAGVPQNQSQPQIDQELAKRVTDLYAGVDAVLEEMRVPEEERKEVEQNLMEAIAADLLVRLGTRLSEEDKKELAALGEGMAPNTEPDLNKVAEFFRGKFSQEELVTALAEATESVLTEFTDAMKR